MNIQLTEKDSNIDLNATDKQIESANKLKEKEEQSRVSRAQIRYIRDFLISVLEKLPENTAFKKAINDLRSIEPSIDISGLDDIYIKSKMMYIVASAALSSGLLGPHKQLPILQKVLLRLLYDDGLKEELESDFSKSAVSSDCIEEQEAIAFSIPKLLNMDELDKIILNERVQSFFCQKKFREINIYNELISLKKSTKAAMIRYEDLKRTGWVEIANSKKPKAIIGSDNDVKIDVDCDQDQEMDCVVDRHENITVGTTGLNICVGYYIYAVHPKKNKEKIVVGHLSSFSVEDYETSKANLKKEGFQIRKTFISGGNRQNLADYLPLLYEPLKHPELTDVHLCQPPGGVTMFFAKTDSPKKVHVSSDFLEIDLDQEEKDDRFLWCADAKGPVTVKNTASPYFKNEHPVISPSAERMREHDEDLDLPLFQFRST